MRMAAIHHSEHDFASVIRAIPVSKCTNGYTGHKEKVAHFTGLDSSVETLPVEYVSLPLCTNLRPYDLILTALEERAGHSFTGATSDEHIWALFSSRISRETTEFRYRSPLKRGFAKPNSHIRSANLRDFALTMLPNGALSIT